MQIFEDVLFFKLRTKEKQKNKTINSTYLVSVGCGRMTEGLPRKFARFTLFRSIKKRAFHLLCVLDLFFRTLAVNSVSDYLRCQPSSTLSSSSSYDDDADMQAIPSAKESF